MRPAASILVWSLLAAATVTLVAHPVVLAAATAAILLVVAARGALGTFASYARYALLIGLALIAVNPIVAPLGRTVLLRATWTLPVVGRPVVTLEALAFGATQTLRLVGLLAPFAVLSTVEPDALLDVLDDARLRGRSALATALSIRFLPTIAEDARAIRSAQQARGLDVDGVKGALPVLQPLLARSIDRGFDVAEALAARGYGAGARSRLLPAGSEVPPWAVLAAVPVGASLAGFGAYAFYPALAPLALAPLDVAWTLIAVACLAAPAIGRWRP